MEPTPEEEQRLPFLVAIKRILVAIKRRHTCFLFVAMIVIILQVVSQTRLLSNMLKTSMNDQLFRSFLQPQPATSAPTNSVFMISIADESFQKRYSVLFRAMSTYASKYGYKWQVLGKSETDSECEEKHSRYFFRKHCIVAHWMEKATKPGDRILVFDADVVPYRIDTSLDYWLNKTLEDDLVFYDRTWNSEVMAGNYLIKNTEQSRNFLMDWAAFENETPPGFSSADNGAIHLHLLRVLGHHTTEKCGKMYSNLTAPVTNLGEW